MTSGLGTSAKGSLGSQLSVNTTREGCTLPGQAAGQGILSLPDGPTGKNTLATTGSSVWNFFSPMPGTHSEAPGSLYIPVFISQPVPCPEEHRAAAQSGNVFVFSA